MVAAIEPLERGRAAHARRAWKTAWESLSRAADEAPLEASDLERLATAAYMVGREDEYRTALERAHHARLEADEWEPAVRCAFWLTMHHALRGETGPATGWLGRAQRLMERHGPDSVEAGWLQVPVAFRHAAGGDPERADAIAGEAAATAERFGDADLLALAIHMQGQCRITRGRIEEGLGLLDEAMVAVTAGELSPIVTGLVYCSVIDTCQEVYALPRARQWTAALSRWCDAQPDMVAFTGRCLVHRAEVLQLHGAWEEALDESRRAIDRPGMSRSGASRAFYRQGELHRLRGEFELAEEAYRRASLDGREPQPGLALLRLARGDAGAADAMIRRALEEAADPLARARLLPARVEVLLAAGDVDGAGEAVGEIEAIADRFGSDVLEAIVAHLRGRAEMERGDPAAALPELRRAARLWHALEAPYEAARARVRLGLACRALGDEETARMEIDAARRAFEELGAGPDARRALELVSDPATAPGGLTGREVEVLRLVITGMTNREIAEELSISHRTVDRHLSNIFTKLGVSSRAAATAWAYEHGLV